jgi:hypothetical protein
MRATVASCERSLQQNAMSILTLFLHQKCTSRQPVSTLPRLLFLYTLAHFAVVSLVGFLTTGDIAR